MSLVFSVPGKTFIAGEYLALQEGPTLVFLSQPYFELEVNRGRGSLGSIHPDSPAGLFTRKHQDYFSQFDLVFKDPYAGKGGFGASTAQFLGAYALWLYQEASQQDMEKLLDFKHLLEAYYEVAWKGEGQRPSGADLVGQLKGALTFFEKRQGLISVKSWPFTDLEMHLLHTGNKVATHEHLKNLKTFDVTDLEKSFAAIRASFEDHDSAAFIAGITSYGEALKKLGFTCNETLFLLNEIQQIPGVMTAKGCGALGADVVLVITRKNESEHLAQFCQSRRLSLTASSQKIANGLQVRGTL
ncbi:MAG: hypothetical protein OM95_00045 [Bdellovibrio sp. ArHS]|uniref:hypothetical protein n=1 Tax=Bdellovibrio sp. ArHS TaxID=1569284 RepID=UPI00058347A3|nr:hypothetical protein [Bdellovibrio sp. ArHS]KHD89967.1 MAG: hypothetical protein OM95_00045 [Bdellovibrio sp. ArHS]